MKRGLAEPLLLGLCWVRVGLRGEEVMITTGAKGCALAVALVMVLGLAGCGGGIKKAQEIEGLKESRRPSLMVQPVPGRAPLVYPYQAGVFIPRDLRSMAFYGGSDDFFQEDDVAEALGNTLYFDLKSSGLFAAVMPIRETAPERLEQPLLMQAARAAGVDLLIVPDITRFTMVREKLNKAEDDMSGADFEIKVTMSMAVQVIVPSLNVAVFAEELKREAVIINTTGALGSELGQPVRAVIAGLMQDLRAIMPRTARPLPPGALGPGRS